MAIAAIAIESSYVAFDERDFQNGEDLERRILLLSSARRLITSNTVVSILMSEETNVDLVRCDYYPYHNRIEELLRHLGLDTVYSANDVRVIVQEVIGRSESLEEYIGLTVALYENDIVISPDCTQWYSDGRLFDVFVQALGTIATGIVVNASMGNTIRLSCPPSNWCSCVQFSGTLHATEPDIGFQGKISEKVLLSDEYRTFIESLDGLTLWRSAEDAEGLVFSLFVGAVKRQAEAGSLENLTDLQEFTIGSEFAGSLARNQAMGSGRFSGALYERALSVVCGNKGKEMWRKGPNGRNQIRREDHAFAWRSHVTSRHEALRLMYWKSGEKVELANVGVKNELIIEEGNGRVVSSLIFVKV